MDMHSQLKSHVRSGVVQQRLGCSHTEVARLCRRGELEFISTDLGRLINIESVERYELKRAERIAEHTAKQAEKVAA
jgi:hypothetical protein